MRSDVRAMRSLMLIALGVAVALSPADAQQRTRVRVIDTLRLQLDSARPLIVQYVNRRARLGVVVETSARATDSIGAYISAVVPGGPAARAGIESGDIVVRLDGTPLVERQQARVQRGESVPGLRLIELAAKLDPDDTVEVVLRRGKTNRTVTLVTEAEPFRFVRTPEGGFAYAFGDSAAGWEGARALESVLRRFDERYFEELREPLRGDLARGTFRMLELAPVNPALGSYFGTSEGILVVNVSERSSLNLKPGDVILTVDGRQPSSPGHLLRILRTYERGEAVKLEIMRDRRRTTVTGRAE